jgi:diketogulonate reductase-like aldo/keto reductase
VVAIRKATGLSTPPNAAVFDFELTEDEMRRVADASPSLSTRLSNLGPAVMGLRPF